MSKQLQNEIIDHKKYLKENQEKMFSNLQEYKDCRKKLKRRK